MVSDVTRNSFFDDDDEVTDEDVEMLKWLAALPVIPKNIRGVEYTAECPYCGGTIRAVREQSQGHYRAQCDKCHGMVME